jgi:hypothetical protein
LCCGTVKLEADKNQRPLLPIKPIPKQISIAKEAFNLGLVSNNEEVLMTT